MSDADMNEKLTIILKKNVKNPTETLKAENQTIYDTDPTFKINMNSFIDRFLKKESFSSLMTYEERRIKEYSKITTSTAKQIHNNLAYLNSEPRYKDDKMYVSRGDNFCVLRTIYSSMYVYYPNQLRYKIQKIRSQFENIKKKERIQKLLDDHWNLGSLEETYSSSTKCESLTKIINNVSNFIDYNIKIKKPEERFEERFKFLRESTNKFDIFIKKQVVGELSEKYDYYNRLDLEINEVLKIGMFIEYEFLERLYFYEKTFEIGSLSRYYKEDLLISIKGEFKSLALERFLLTDFNNLGDTAALHHVLYPLILCKMNVVVELIHLESPPYGLIQNWLSDDTTTNCFQKWVKIFVISESQTHWNGRIVPNERITKKDIDNDDITNYKTDEDVEIDNLKNIVPDIPDKVLNAITTWTEKWIILNNKIKNVKNAKVLVMGVDSLKEKELDATIEKINNDINVLSNTLESVFTNAKAAADAADAAAAPGPPGALAAAKAEADKAKAAADAAAAAAAPAKPPSLASAKPPGPPDPSKPSESAEKDPIVKNAADKTKATAAYNDLNFNTKTQDPRFVHIGYLSVSKEDAKRQEAGAGGDCFFHAIQYAMDYKKDKKSVTPKKGRPLRIELSDWARKQTLQGLGKDLGPSIKETYKGIDGFIKHIESDGEWVGPEVMYLFVRKYQNYVINLFHKTEEQNRYFCYHRFYYYHDDANDYTKSNIVINLENQLNIFVSGSIDVHGSNNTHYQFLEIDDTTKIIGHKENTQEVNYIRTTGDFKPPPQAKKTQITDKDTRFIKLSAYAISRIGSTPQIENPLWFINKKPITTPKKIDFNSDTKYIREQKTGYDYVTKSSNNQINGDTGINNNYNEVIWFYNKDKYFYEFTNFYPMPVVIDGIQWPTTEHYFQYMKLKCAFYPGQQDNYDDLNKFLSDDAPSNAFTIGQTHIIKNELWTPVSKMYMYKALFHKFTQNKELYDLLMSTRGMVLVEHAIKDESWNQKTKTPIPVKRKDYIWGDFGIDNWAKESRALEADKVIEGTVKPLPTFENAFKVDVSTVNPQFKKENGEPVKVIYNWLGILLMCLREKLFNAMKMDGDPTIYIADHPNRLEIIQIPQVIDKTKFPSFAKAVSNAETRPKDPPKLSDYSDAVAVASPKKAVHFAAPPAGIGSLVGSPAAAAAAHSPAGISPSVPAVSAVRDKDYQRLMTELSDDENRRIIDKDIANFKKTDHWGWWIWPNDSGNSDFLKKTTAEDLLQNDNTRWPLYWRQRVKYLTRGFEQNTHVNFFTNASSDPDLGRVFNFARFWFGDVYNNNNPAIDLDLVYDFINAMFNNHYIKRWYFVSNHTRYKHLKEGYEAFKKYANEQFAKTKDKTKKEKYEFHAVLCERSKKYVVSKDKSQEIANQLYKADVAGTEIKNNTVGVIIAGNAGKPMGGVSIKDKDGNMCNVKQDWTRSDFSTQEESVVAHWLQHYVMKEKSLPTLEDAQKNAHDSDAQKAFEKAACKNGKPEWGLKDIDRSTETYQGVVYTKELKSYETAKDYYLAFLQKDAPLAFKDKGATKEFLDVVLAYTFGPNVYSNSDDRPSLKKTYAPNYEWQSDFKYFREAVKKAIKACFDEFVKDGKVVYPIVCKVSGGIYSGPSPNPKNPHYPSATQAMLDYEYELIVEELLSENASYKSKFKRVYFSDYDSKEIQNKKIYDLTIPYASIIGHGKPKSLGKEDSIHKDIERKIVDLTKTTGGPPAAAPGTPGTHGKPKSLGKEDSIHKDIERKIVDLTKTTGGPPAAAPGTPGTHGTPGTPKGEDLTRSDEEEAETKKIELSEEEIEEIEMQVEEKVFYSDVEDEGKYQNLVNVINGVRLTDEGVEIQLPLVDGDKGEKGEKGEKAEKAITFSYKQLGIENWEEAKEKFNETKRAVICTIILDVSKGGGAKNGKKKRSARGRGAVVARKTLRRTRRRAKRGGEGPGRRHVVVILNYEKVKDTLKSEGEAGDRMREQMMRDIQKEMEKIAEGDDGSEIQIQFSSEVNQLLKERKLFDKLKSDVAGARLLVRGPPDDDTKRKIVEDAKISAVNEKKQKMSDDEILENTLGEYTDIEMQKYNRMRKRRKVGAQKDEAVANRVKQIKVREQTLGGFKFGTYTFTAAVSAFSGIIFALLFNPII